jgi:hypothetical protein
VDLAHASISLRRRDGAILSGYQGSAPSGSWLSRGDPLIGRLLGNAKFIQSAVQIVRLGRRRNERGTGRSVDDAVSIKGVFASDGRRKLLRPLDGVDRERARNVSDVGPVIVALEDRRPEAGDGLVDRQANLHKSFSEKRQQQVK